MNALGRTLQFRSRKICSLLDTTKSFYQIRFNSSDITKTVTETPSLLNEFESRGMLYQVTHQQQLAGVLSDNKKKFSAYCGFDPTAKSLHVGNLLSILALLRFQMAGHDVIALVGGATGQIGDPSGKSSERNMLDKQVLAENTDAIQTQIYTLFRNAKTYISSKPSYKNIEWGQLKVLNNADWLSSLSLIEFLSTAGRHARVSEMISRDSVANRLKSESGISFTEFTYQLLQAFDFWHLYSKYGCRVQVGGSDQWGNIVEGTHLIRKMLLIHNASTSKVSIDDSSIAEASAFGLTIPLLVNKDGQKFGKSEGNAIWLDSALLSPQQFYSFFRKTADEDVEKLLRMLTFLTAEEIQDVLLKREMNDNTYAQRVLAAEVTALVHGEYVSRAVQVQSALLFDENSSSLKSQDIIEAFRGHRTYQEIPRSEAIGKNVVSLAKDVNLIPSIKQGRKQVGFGGFYINDSKVLTHEKVVEETDLIDGSILLLRIGKSQYRVIHLVS